MHLQRPDGMILIAPAAYDASIVPDRIRFGKEFTDRIRDTYMKSDGFELMSRFSCPLLLISFSGDTVVPAEITDAYFASAQRRKWRYEFPGGHVLFQRNGIVALVWNSIRQRFIADEIVHRFDSCFTARQ